MHTGWGLRELLLGPPLGSDAAGVEALLDTHLDALCELLPREYGDTPACKQAVLELQRVRKEGALASKRAMLSFSVQAEPAVAAYWASDPASAAYARDLSERVTRASNRFATAPPRRSRIR